MFREAMTIHSSGRREERGERMISKKIICELWEEFSDIPCDDSGNIQESFLGFEVGTNREEIWHWFDKYIPVHRLLYEFDDVKRECTRYGVVVCKYGYVEVDAVCEAEAINIVNDKCVADDINWDDDWMCIDAHKV